MAQMTSSHTKYLTFFMAAALIAALLEGCEKPGAQEKAGAEELDGIGKHGAEEKANGKTVEEKDNGIQTCTVAKALRSFQINGYKGWQLSDFEQAECVLHKGSKSGEVLPFSEADTYVFSEENPVFFRCKNGGGPLRQSQCNDMDHLLHAWIWNNMDGFPSTGPSSSLVQHVEVSATKPENGADLQKTDDIRQVVNTAQGLQFAANKTLKSSRPVYRLPRAKRAVGDATVHEMEKMDPKVFAHMHAEEGK
mmetsp:Transcript_12376/g.23294  ORF Transcript_12376/g.23294 Transcript_12376/m.23294 type:complete len:250 (-) Transcript_12376:78-827(-)